MVLVPSPFSLGCVAMQQKKKKATVAALPSPSSLHLLALQKEEEKSNVAFFAALHCSIAPQEEEEGDDNVATVAFFIALHCNITK